MSTHAMPRTWTLICKLYLKKPKFVIIFLWVIFTWFLQSVSSAKREISVIQNIALGLFLSYAGFIWFFLWVGFISFFFRRRVYFIYSARVPYVDLGFMSMTSSDASQFHQGYLSCDKSIECQQRSASSMNWIVELSCWFIINKLILSSSTDKDGDHGDLELELSIWPWSDNILDHLTEEHI